MELTDEQKVRHGSGIQNYYYGGVSKVINLKLTTEQLKTIVDSNVFNGSVGQFAVEKRKRFFCRTQRYYPASCNFFN